MSSEIYITIIVLQSIAITVLALVKRRVRYFQGEPNQSPSLCYLKGLMGDAVKGAGDNSTAKIQGEFGAEG